MTSHVSIGEDYYIKDDKIVFTTLFLLKRGYCCNNNCRHCPYKVGKDSSMSQVSPFSNEEVTILQEAVLRQIDDLENLKTRLSKDVQLSTISAKIQQLELLLLKIKSFKNN